MIRYIDTFKSDFGTRPCCRVQGSHLEGGFITSRGYRAAKTTAVSARHLQDQMLIPELIKIHEANYGVYGVCKMWKAMHRQGWSIGREQTLHRYCTAERLWALVFSLLCGLKECLLTVVKQAIFEAKRLNSDFTQIVHHSDKGSQ